MVTPRRKCRRPAMVKHRNQDMATPMRKRRHCVHTNILNTHDNFKNIVKNILSYV